LEKENKMADHVSPESLEADRKALAALQNLRDYKPADSAYSVSALAGKLKAIEAARAEDAVIAAEWDFHNALSKARDAVAAQYGEDSPQVQSLGLKKKLTRRRPSGRS
jgi:hypothetical protein